MNITDKMSEGFEEHYNYENILKLTKCIYGLLQAAHNCFKEYIKNMNLKVGFKK